MKVDLSPIVNKNATVAVAVSGGSDSMALLYYMQKQAKNNLFNLIAINVEHGIRGTESINDSNFVKEYCKNHGIKLLSYKCDAIKKANESKLSIEQSARELRYDCFFDALNKNKCDYIATAHHQRDNIETVLINLFRGTGLKGVTGINDGYNGKIIRPFINVSKAEIEDYIVKNNIPFVEDSSNFSDEYTRNFIRLNVLPKVKEVFPEAEKNVARFSEIAKKEDDFLDELADKYLTVKNDGAEILLSTPSALAPRVVIKALKAVGLKKDWEQIHADIIVGLKDAKNGTTVNLPKDVLATKEYDKIVIYKKLDAGKIEIPLNEGEIFLPQGKLMVQPVLLKDIDLKNGFFGDKDKIPENSVIRYKQDGDVFTKFGGGTKKLCDYFTDKKIPVRKRDFIPLLCSGSDVLVIFNVGISDKIKIDEHTTNVLKFDYEES